MATEVKTEVSSGLGVTGSEDSNPKPRFVFPQIQDNPNGWGPCQVPHQFKDTPYQPFSKDDRLGKVSSSQNILVLCLFIL